MTIVGNSDTALVARPASVGDSIAWLRWVTVSDGIVRDSMAVGADGSGLGLVAKPFPGGDRLLVLQRRTRSGTASITTRSGVVLDSLVFTSPRIPVSVDVAPDGQSIIATMPRTQVEDELDFLRYRVSSRGRISATPDTVARQIAITTGGDLGQSGAMVFGYGPTEFSVWALRRDSPTGMRFSQRRLASSTVSISGSLSPTGDRVLVNRPSAAGGERRQFAIMPFDSGPESPLGPPMELVDWDWAQDGRSITLVLPRGQDSLAIARLDVAHRGGPRRPAPSRGMIMWSWRRWPAGERSSSRIR